MSPTIRLPIPQKTAHAFRRWIRLSTVIAAVCLFAPIAAHAQAGGGSPFDTGFTALQTLFTGTVAKVNCEGSGYTHLLVVFVGSVV